MIREYDFDAVMTRLKTISNAASFNELAALMGLSSSNYANYKKRNSIPFEKAAALAHSLNVSLDWVLTGQGPMRLVNTYAAPDPLEPAKAAEPAPQSPVRRELWDMLDSLDEDAQRLILDEAAKIREMALIKKRLAELEGKKRKPKAKPSSSATQTFNGPVQNAPGRDVRNYYGGGKGDK